MNGQTVEEASALAQSYIGQKRIWMCGNAHPTPIVVTCNQASITVSFGDNAHVHGPSQIWCTYIDCYGKLDTVWFARTKFDEMGIAP